MNLGSVLLGLAICAYALVVLGLRLTGKEGAFRKVEAMRQRFGPVAGSALHYVAYVVVPLAFGGLLLAAGLKGVSIGEFFGG